MNAYTLFSFSKCIFSLQFYIKTMLPVWMVNCSDPNEVGVAQYCIPAVVYVAQDKWTHKGNLLLMDLCVVYLTWPNILRKTQLTGKTVNFVKV